MHTSFASVFFAWLPKLVRTGTRTKSFLMSYEIARAYHLHSDTQQHVAHFKSKRRLWLNGGGGNSNVEFRHRDW